MTRSLTLEVPYEGQPATGYVALPAVADPPAAEIRGPESLVAAVTFLKTRPVNLGGASEGFRKEVALHLDETAGIAASPSVVQVTVPIREEIATRVFDGIGLGLSNLSGRAAVQPDTIGLTVRGPSTLLKKGGIREQIHVYIDCRDLGPGVYVRRAVIRLPVGLILTGARPELFTVTLE
jgi:YbbR domain-containing protein